MKKKLEINKTKQTFLKSNFLVNMQISLPIHTVNCYLVVYVNVITY